MVVLIRLQSCHIISNGFGCVRLLAAFRAALLSLSRYLKVGSVKACGLTMRAPDCGESARFSSRFLAWSEFRQNRVISARPLAGNAEPLGSSFLKHFNEKYYARYKTN